MVLLEQEEDGGLRTLTRHLIAFRVVSKHYKQADKAHRLRLDEARDLATKLRRTGFRVRNTRHCGHYPVSRAHTALLAHKPSKLSQAARPGSLCLAQCCYWWGLSGSIPASWNRWLARVGRLLDGLGKRAGGRRRLGSDLRSAVASVGGTDLLDEGPAWWLALGFVTPYTLAD